MKNIYNKNINKIHFYYIQTFIYKIHVYVKNFDHYFKLQKRINIILVKI